MQSVTLKSQWLWWSGAPWESPHSENLFLLLHSPSRPWSRRRRRSREWTGGRTTWRISPSEACHCSGWWRTAAGAEATRSATSTCCQYHLQEEHMLVQEIILMPFSGVEGKFIAHKYNINSSYKKIKRHFILNFTWKSNVVFLLWLCKSIPSSSFLKLM